MKDEHTTASEEEEEEKESNEQKQPATPPSRHTCSHGHSHSCSRRHGNNRVTYTPLEYDIRRPPQGYDVHFRLPAMVTPMQALQSIAIGAFIVVALFFVFGLTMGWIIASK